jgi:hypothetical protein
MANRMCSFFRGEFLSSVATKAAFDIFRTQYGPEWGPRLVRHPSECDQLDAQDGLTELPDGDFPSTSPVERLAPYSKDSLPVPLRLWVVRTDDVVHAEEICPFGAARPAGFIKHSNLTGGRPAFSGGEMMFIAADTLVVSGYSGRYGPRSADECGTLRLPLEMPAIPSIRQDMIRKRIVRSRSLARHPG